MNQNDRQSEITELIERAFAKHPKGFISLKALLALFDGQGLALLELNRNSNQNAVESALLPLKKPYHIGKYGSSKMLFKGPPAEVALEYIREKKGKTFGQLNKDFPVVKGMFLDLVNGLLDRGDLKVRLSATAKPILYPSGKKPIQPSLAEKKKPSIPVAVKAPQAEVEPPRQVQALPADFKRAYDTVGKGSNYVFIHQIRKYLGWSRKQFDELLYRMMVEGYVAAHPGNPGALTAEEVRDSFQDEFGDLYITISWRKPV